VLDQPAIERNRSIAEKLIVSKCVERASREKPASTFSQRPLGSACGAFKPGVHFMRVILSTVLSLSLAAPAAFAMPVAKPALQATPAAQAIAPVAKKQAKAKAPPKAKARQAKRGKPDLGGIHPLVGSGDY